MCAKYVSEAGDAFVGAKTMGDNLFPRPHFLLPSASGYPGSRWYILLQFIHCTTISNTSTTSTTWKINNPRPKNWCHLMWIWRFSEGYPGSRWYTLLQFLDSTTIGNTFTIRANMISRIYNIDLQKNVLSFCLIFYNFDVCLFPNLMPRLYKAMLCAID